MWFIGVEVEQETSAPPPKKKSWIRPWGVFKRRDQLAFFWLDRGHSGKKKIQLGRFSGKSKEGAKVTYPGG